MEDKTKKKGSYLDFDQNTKTQPEKLDQWKKAPKINMLVLFILYLCFVVDVGKTLYKSESIFMSWE